MLASISSLPSQPTFGLFLSHPPLFILEFKEGISSLHFTASRVKLNKSNRGEQKEALNLKSNGICGEQSVCVPVLDSFGGRGAPTVRTAKLKY